MTQLTDSTDDVLDASLTKLYQAHELSMAAGDMQAKAECHWAIQQILDEQSRRLDAWINEHTKEPA